MAPRAAGKRPAVNFSLQKPKSPTHYLHSLLNKIEQELPSFALEDGQLISPFLLEQELSHRYPSLTKVQLKIIIQG